MKYLIQKRHKETYLFLGKFLFTFNRKCVFFYRCSLYAAEGIFHGIEFLWFGIYLEE